MPARLDTDFFAPDKPRAFAHRGSAGTHPENTLESFRAAVAMGAPYVEFDVHMTRDGQVVVHHDENLERTCGHPGVIREMSCAELAAQDAGRMFSVDDGASFPFRGRGLKVPRLADVLAEVAGLRMIVEIKQTTPSLVAPMLNVIDRAGIRRNVLIASEHQAPLDEVRRLAPGVPTNFSYLESGGFLQAMAAHDANYRPPAAALQVPREYESWQIVTPDSVGFAHSLGLEVHVWTVNDESEMTELLDMGVDGLISDFPERLLRVIAARTSASHE